MTLRIPSLPPFLPAQLLNVCGFLNSCPSAARSSIFAISLMLCFTFLFSPKRRLSSLPPALLLKSPACALCQPTPTRSHRAREPTGAVPAEDPSPCLSLPAPVLSRVDKSGQGRVFSTMGNMELEEERLRCVREQETIPSLHYSIYHIHLLSLKSSKSQENTTMLEGHYGYIHRLSEAGEGEEGGRVS